MSITPKAPVRRLWLSVLCGYLALGATLQELPGYVTVKFGAGPAVTGLAIGAAFLATAVCRPFAGRAGDAGRARPVVMAGGGLTAIAAAGHLLAPGVGVLLVARLLMGAGEAALFSAGLPWVLAGVPAGRRGRVAGWFGLSMWGGLTLGPLLAVAVHGLAGGTAVWRMVTALPLISTVLVFTTGGQVRPYAEPPAGIPPAQVPQRERSDWPKRAREVVPAGAGVPGLVLGLAAYGYGAITALVVLYLSSEHLGGERVALSIYAIAFLVTRSVGSPQVDARGPVLLARMSVAVETVGLLLVATGTSTVPVLAGVAITGVGLGTIYPATSALTLQRANARLPGAAMGAMTSLWDLGILVAGPVSGLLAGRAGYPTAFTVAAGISVTALLLTTSLRPSPQ
ncbi:MFS transporter [Streptomyces asiaticus]